MKKIKLFSVIAVVFALGGFIFSHNALAQTENHTTREEAEGEIVWQNLQSDEIECTDISDDDFAALGEYFMGKMLGDSHEAMNEMMTQMHGEDGEKQIHITMGKRLSGCDDSASFPMENGWMPMMNMMQGGWASPSNNFSNNMPSSMMNFGYGFGFSGWILWIIMILFWALVITSIAALVRLTTGKPKSGQSKKSALDILKERYARGEIDEKEFEDKKKVLS